jgi:hypothetical protein
MSSTVLARRALRAHSIFRRPALSRAQSASAELSSATALEVDAASTSQPAWDLPPEKLRHLITLFHDASTYVTRETLDARIIDAFVTTPTTSSQVMAPYKNYNQLKTVVIRRKDEPNMNTPLESAKDPRIKRVFGALYGTDRGNLPGLELMIESWDAIGHRIVRDDVERGQLMAGEVLDSEKKVSETPALVEVRRKKGKKAKRVQKSKGGH